MESERSKSRGLVSLNSDTRNTRCITFAKLSQLSRCLLAALTVNCEVYIYGPGSDAVKSVWQEVWQSEFYRLITSIADINVSCCIFGLFVMQVFDLTSVYLEALRKDPFLPYSADTLTSGDEQKAKRDQFTMQAQSTCK